LLQRSHLRRVDPRHPDRRRVWSRGRLAGLPTEPLGPEEGLQAGWRRRL